MGHASREPEPLPRSSGWVVLGAFAALLAAGVAHRLPDDAALTWTAGAVAAVAGALSIFGPARITFPTATAGCIALTVLCNGESSNIGWFAMLALVGGCILTGPWVYGIGLGVAAVLVFVVQIVFVEHDQGWLPWIAGTVFTLVVCGLGRRQHDLVGQLRRAQTDLAQRAQTEERARIARELHDVIAHSLTVSLMHVSSARLALADDPDDAARALAEAERLGRASLDEVRHAVGTLHRGDAPDPTAPLPGSTDVPALIESFTAAGADVRASLDVDLAAVPATTGLAAYRILQEALTNAAKHAPHARVTVLLRSGSGAVSLDVDSAGAPGAGSGHGLTGMRERAQSVGGSVEAGPGGSGWRVHAELPL